MADYYVFSHCTLGNLAFSIWSEFNTGGSLSLAVAGFEVSLKFRQISRDLAVISIKFRQIWIN